MIGEVTEAVDKWHEQRWSKFTASDNFKLLGNDNKGNLFGATAMSHIEKKAMERCTVMWERPELEEVEAFLHGKMYEYPAFKAYTQITGYDMIYLGSENPLFLDDEDLIGEAGGSPDAILLNSGIGIIRGAEIKCPKNPMNHFKRLKWKDQWDIKEGLIQAYCQIQHLLKITKAPVWDWVSYDERMKRHELRIKIIPVYPDKKFQTNLHFRLIKAVEERDKIITEYTNFNK